MRKRLSEGSSQGKTGGTDYGRLVSDGRLARGAARAYLTDDPRVCETTDFIDEGILEDREHFDPTSRRYNELLNVVPLRPKAGGLSLYEEMKFDPIEFEAAKRSGPVYTRRLGQAASE